MRYHFFYGGVFCQWAPHSFTIDGEVYNCAEQYMMTMKALQFHDIPTLKKIMATTDPYEQKQLGRQVRNFCLPEWNKTARHIVYDANYAKFSQNKNILANLLQTPGHFVEASPVDCVWGIGLGESDPDCYRLERWRGLNWLGEVLNQVRNDIQFGIGQRKPWEHNWSKIPEKFPESCPV